MRKIVTAIIFLTMGGRAMAGGTVEPFHSTVEYVDMNRFSGAWYVIALIPTPFEKGASFGIENYTLDTEGNIKVTYTFKKKNRERIMHQKGWIFNKNTNAEWRIRPFWPLSLPYYILELDEEYSYTVIGTKGFSYLWIMSRSPKIDDSLLNQIIDRLQRRGYDPEKIQIMKQNGES